MKTVSVIGAGSWGTALAVLLAGIGHSVRLWARRVELAEALIKERENKAYLPGVVIPPAVSVYHDLGAVLQNAQLVLSAIPSHTVREIYTKMLPHLDSDMILVSATKGIENETLMRMSEVIRDVVGVFRPRIVALSGPSFAREVVLGHPTTVVAASSDAEAAAVVQRECSAPHFRIYRNSDLTGTELGGSVKNVIAIAAGVVRGLGFGSNTLAGLVCRGLAEMRRLAAALGARQETLSGLAGLGDLVLTCTGELSRNRSVGVELGRGRALEEITARTSMVAEGIRTTPATLRLAQKHHVEMPITEQMHAVLYERKPPRQAIEELMVRSLKDE
ncbi:MAG: NAD(P)-dependent glycerol-3-phosphate dehydrogenase [Acidobacteria bacterium]|nr:NAD(P)-dependent glycerol-3-phosphate dehydrogenase [Acidobacteriota bacterium]